ncbi:hypothetical protein KSS87_013593, partial [Heliosperma pusillum]
LKVVHFEKVISLRIKMPPSPIKPLDDQISLADVDVIKVIGKGNNVIVQLVQHKRTNQFFAIKVIHMNIQESDRKRTAKELEINRFLECPYVVACYQCFYQNNAFYLILEYMDGGSLLDFLRKVHTIPEDHLAAICKQVVKGLHYLHHQKHVIHRDLKPSNLLINHLGEVKITDFGVSAIVASTSAQANTNVGTYYYMGPERFSEETHGASSDIWSLGMVMLEFATGKYPYAISDDSWAATYFSVMQTIIEQPPPRASPDQFSPEFCSFISSCLQKDPKARLSAQQLLEHPFLSMYDDLAIDLASYFTNEATIDLR